MQLNHEAEYSFILLISGSHPHTVGVEVIAGREDEARIVVCRPVVHRLRNAVLWGERLPVEAVAPVTQNQEHKVLICNTRIQSVLGKKIFFSIEFY